MEQTGSPEHYLRPEGCWGALHALVRGSGEWWQIWLEWNDWHGLSVSRVWIFFWG